MSAANILIIEDDADVREGVRILLEGEDYTVAEAPDGASGLKLVSEELYYAWEQIYYVDFADGEAEVVLHGYYYYQFYNYLTVGALLAAFLLFLTVVMAGIRRTIRYIRALSGEIRILEGAIWSIPSPSGGGTSSPSWPRAWRPCASPSGSRRRASGGSPRPTSGWSPRCPTICAPP